MRDTSQSIAALLRQDRRYKFEAYVFVFEALNYAHNVLEMGNPAESEPAPGGEEEPQKRGQERHVTGRELCHAVRRFALEQYGYMAKTVLQSWGIHATGDLGEIVFNLIRIGEMRKTRDDRREDFDNVYDFDVAFRQEFKITPPEPSSP